MNVDDLRRELSERADGAQSAHPHTRVAAVHARIVERRRRVVAGGVTATALAVAAVALAPVALDRAAQPAPPAPATSPATPKPETPKPDRPFAWPTEYEGDKLLVSAIGDPGDDRVTRRFVPYTTDLQWASLCTAPWLKSYASIKVNGHAIGGMSCSTNDRPSGPGFSVLDGVSSARWWAEMGLRPGEPSVIEVVMTGKRALPDDARLGFAVWDKSGPRVTSDGVTLNRLWQDEDDLYRLVAYRTKPLTDSERTLSLAVPEDVDDPVVLTGLGGPYRQTRRSLTSVNITGSRQGDASAGGGIGADVFTDIAGETVTVREKHEQVSGTLVVAIYAPID